MAGVLRLKLKHTGATMNKKILAGDDIGRVFRKLKLEKREAREYFRRLHTRSQPAHGVRIVQWLSNDTSPLVKGERNA
jgi:hypothetical protein